MADFSTFLQDLKSKVDISDIVKRRVNLKQNGNGRFLGLCPFHNEKTPSFNVNDNDGYFKCFGCGESGDVFNFVEKTEGYSFIESVKHVCDVSGVEMPQFNKTNEDKEKQTSKSNVLEILESTCNYYQKMLLSEEGLVAINYLKKRKISKNAVKFFKIGYSPKSGIVDYLIREGFKKEDIVKAGLARLNDNGELYDFFRGRLMFPITNAMGRVIAFGGRFLGDYKKYKTGKYLNSPETEVFKKSEVLFNLKEARRCFKDSVHKSIIVVEGYMDVVSMWDFGIQNAVAPMGTAMGAYQLGMVWKFIDEPILCFDGDDAGKLAAWKTTLNILPNIENAKSANIVLLPENMDPDDILKKYSIEKFIQLVDGMLPLSKFVWNYEFLNNNGGTPERLSRLEKTLNDHAEIIKDVSVKKNYQYFFKNMIWENIRSNKKQINNNGGYLNKNYKKGTGVENNINFTFEKRDILNQSVLLLFFINFPKYAPAFISECNECFTNKALLDIYSFVVNLSLDNEAIVSAEVIKQLNSSKYKNVVDKICSSNAEFYLKNIKNADDDQIIEFVENIINNIALEKREKLLSSLIIKEYQMSNLDLEKIEKLEKEKESILEELSSK